MAKTYRVVPFLPAISEKQASKQGAELIARQLQEAINAEAGQGWAFEHYEGIAVTVQMPGCLGSRGVRAPGGLPHADLLPRDRVGRRRQPRVSEYDQPRRAV